MDIKAGKREQIGLVAAFLLLGSASAGMAQECAAGDHKLATSGLCASVAKTMMPPVSQSFVDGLAAFECKAKLNDAQLSGDVLLYYAADCGNGPVQLEVSAGAHSANLTVLKGGINQAGAEPYDLGTILTSDPADPTASMKRWDGGDEPGYNSKCKARKVPGTRDQWVIDEYTNSNQPASLDGPRIACGPYGYTEESDAQWRIAHGFAWWADFGQDAYKDYDFSSLTVISNSNGRWAPLKVAAAQPSASPAPAATGGAVRNIAGARETPYGETRGWAVYAGTLGGKFAYCVGVRDYSGTLLRVGFDGRQWQFAVPYEVSPDYTGQFEVDGKVWDMRGTSDGRWAYAWIGQKELDAFRNGNLMILDIARASIDFELIGTAAVTLKVQECVDRSR